MRPPFDHECGWLVELRGSLRWPRRPPPLGSVATPTPDLAPHTVIVLIDPMTGFISQETWYRASSNTPIATMDPVEPPTRTPPPWTPSSRLP